MNKQLLNDYIDACELIKETELKLERLKRKRSTVVMDKVTGSMNDFPYAPTSFKVEGAIDIGHDENAIRQQEQILIERKKNAEQIKQQVEKWMNKIPVRMQRIIRLKFFERLSWDVVASKLGRGATPDGIRMEYYNFMRKEK